MKKKTYGDSYLKINPTNKANFLKKLTTDTTQYKKQASKQKIQNKNIFQINMLQKIDLTNFKGRKRMKSQLNNTSRRFKTLENESNSNVNGNNSKERMKRIDNIKKLLKINVIRNNLLSRNNTYHNQAQKEDSLQKQSYQNTKNQKQQMKKVDISAKRIKLDNQIFNDLKIRSLERYNSPLNQNPLKTQKSHRYESTNQNDHRFIQDKIYDSSQGIINNDMNAAQLKSKLKNHLSQFKQGEAEIFKSSIKQKPKKKTNKNIILVVQQQNEQQQKDSQKITKIEKKAQKQKQQILKQEIKKQFKRRNKLEQMENRRVLQQKDESLQKFQIKFELPTNNKHGLTRDQLKTYGDRFPQGYNKVKLLGRGGFALVWLGEQVNSKRKYAIKQLISQGEYHSHLKQIWFGTYFFQFGGKCKKQFANQRGINNLVKLHYYFINSKDTWLVYQFCGDSLANSLYELKQERQTYNQCKDQIIFKIVYKPLYQKIRLNQDYLRKIILQIAKALELLATNNIVHSDLKTENILIKQKSCKKFQFQLQCRSSSKEQPARNKQHNVKQTHKCQNKKQQQILIEQVKLTDYGSAFIFKDLQQITMATPQYMAPQILNLILYQSQAEYIQKLLQYLHNYKHPWAIDVWSLGCVLLEIVSGIPLWMSYKTIVRNPLFNIQNIHEGLFAVKQRQYDKIITKQIDVIKKLNFYLNQANYSGIVLEPDLRILLRRMLALNPQKRISPVQIISFLQESLQNGTQAYYQDSQQVFQKI